MARPAPLRRKIDAARCIEHDKVTDCDAALPWRLEPRNGAQCRRLAASAGPQQCHTSPSGRGETHAAHGRHGTVRDCQRLHRHRAAGRRNHSHASARRWRTPSTSADHNETHGELEEAKRRHVAGVTVLPQVEHRTERTMLRLE